MTVLPASTIWRDKVVDGVFSSGNHDPVKSDIRAYQAWVEAGLTAGTLNGPWEATKLALDAKLDYGDGNPGFVYDGVDFGTYRKSGASGVGSWVKILDTIPGYQVVKASNAGTGTANAIVATSSPPVSYSDGMQIISLDIDTTNTSEDVTVNFDGLGNLTIKTAANNKPAIGGLVAPVRIWGQIDQSGTVFRMMSDQASAAIQSAAEAAQIAAEIARDDAIAAAGTAGGAKPYATRAAIKAIASPSNGHTAILTESVRGGLFVWRDGDYSAEIAADPLEGIYLKGDGIASSAGAWVRSDGGWAVRGFDARWFDVVVNDATKAPGNSTAIQAAIDLAATLYPGMPVWIPVGTTYLALNQTAIILGHNSPCALILRDKTVLRGTNKLNCRLKIRDNESTDAVPLGWNAMIGNGIYYDIFMDGFTWDLNGQNNKLSPDRSRFMSVTVFNASPGLFRTASAHGLSVGDEVRFWKTAPANIFASPLAERTIFYVHSVTNANDFRISLTLGGEAVNILTSNTTNPVTLEAVGTYASVNAAALMISGTTNVTGDARIIGGKFTNMQVLNGPGWSSFVFGQSVGVAPISDDIEVAHCRFYNNGLDVGDHSSIFANGNNIHVHDCVFDHPTQSTGIMGPAVAMEMHGSNNWFINNTVNNYCQATWICGEFNGPVRNCKAIGNTVNVNWAAFATWTISPLSNSLTDCVISDNTITINGGLIYNLTMDVKVGIYIVNSAGDLRRFNVSGNVLRCTDTRANHGIMVASSGSSPAVVSDIDILGNTLSGFASGIAVPATTRSCYNVNIKTNNVTDVTPSLQLAAGNTRGISVTGTHGSISVQNNSVSAGSGTLEVGIRFGESGNTNSFDNLTASGNRILGATTDIADITSVIGRRKGGDALSKFTALPAESTWDVGDFVPLKSSAKSVQGTAPDRYITQGWVRLTAGSAVGAATLGTDWALRQDLVD